MKYRATAAATDRSNAIGTVELEPTPAGLIVVYLGVGAFQEGYAPGPLAHDARVLVPWASVQQARLEGDQVFVAFDPSCGPHTRLTLVNFSTGDVTHHRERYRQRLVLRIAVIALAVISLLVTVFGAPRMASGGAAVALLVGMMAALAILLVGFAADRWLLLGGASSDVAREQLVAELAVYLPDLLRLPRAPVPSRPPLKLPTFQGLLPRTTLAVVITLTASTLGAVLMAHWIIASERHPAEREKVADRTAVTAGPQTDSDRPQTVEPAVTSRQPSAAAAQVSANTAPMTAPKPGEVATGAKCTCTHASSLLWADPIPRLSILLLSEHTRQKGRRTKLVLEIAVVNNSDQDIRDLELHVTFFERDPPPVNARHFSENRVLYYEGPLAPGKAIMWETEAEGTEFEVENPISGDIGPGGDGAAPLSRFSELLEANHRPVRLHAALMLAYLGDPHAREAALALKEALRDNEAPFLNRILQALGDVRTCRVQQPSVQTPLLRACVFNATNETKQDIGLRIRALDQKPDPAFPVRPPPTVLYASTLRVPAKLAPKTGIEISAPVAVRSIDGGLPAAFEVLSDRIDLLP